MPVSPQDFELYSRMTGAPMPSDAMSRMQMAPDVYKFTKDFARKPNFLEKTGNLAKNIGKGVVFALGAPMVAESMVETERMNEQLRNEGDKTVAQEVTTQEGLSDEQEKTRRKEIEIQDLEKYNFSILNSKESRGFSPFQDEDPFLCRIIAKKM